MYENSDDSSGISCTYVVFSFLCIYVYLYIFIFIIIICIIYNCVYIIYFIII